MRLTGQQLASRLAALPGWQFDEARGGTLSRSFVFRDFAQAMGFMCQVALVAEKRDHHPEWSNVCNRIEVTLTTHDVAGLSANDLALAGYMDEVAAALARQSD